MFGSLTRLFGSGKKSGSLAKSRLHFVLVQDRAGLTNEEMVQFKKELVGVIEKYFVISEREFDIDYRRDRDTTTLLINSPVVVKRHGGSERRGRAAAGARKRESETAAPAI